MKSSLIACVTLAVMMAGCATPPPEVKITRPGGVTTTVAPPTAGVTQKAPAAPVAPVTAAAQPAPVKPRATVAPPPPPRPGLAAIQSAKQRTAADPLNWRSFNELGMAYNKAKLYDEAIAAFEQALALHPITTTVEAERKQQETIDEERAALVEQQRVQQKNQQDAQNAAGINQFMSVMGTMLPTMPGVDPQALAMLPTLNAIATTPSGLPAVAAPGAISKITVESQLKPKREMAGIYFNLGVAHYGKENYSQAVQALDNSLELDLSRVEVLWWEAEACFGQGNYEKSIAMMTRYMALDSAAPAPTCFTRLSESFRALGLEKEARKAFLAAVDEYKRRMVESPDNRDLGRELAFAYAAQDLYADAEKQIVTLLAEDDSEHLLLGLASFQLLQARYAEALESVKTVLNRKEPFQDPAYVWYLAGRANDEVGAAEEAQAAYRKAADLLDSPLAGASMPSYGAVVLAAVGRYDEARKELDSKLAKDPFGSRASMELFRLGLVCEKGGHDVDGIEALNRSLQLRPRYSPATVVLRRLEKRNAATCAKALAAADAALGQKNTGEAIRSLTTAFQLMGNGSQKQQTLQRILRLAAEMDAPPPLTVEGQRYYMRGSAALRSAKEPVTLDRALSEFQWSALYSPWSAPTHLNMSVAYGVRLRYGEAMKSLNLFLTANPKAKNMEEALNKLAELEYQQEESLRSLSFNR